MSIKLTTRKTVNIADVSNSSNSSDYSERKNRTRLRNFKELSTKRNSIMDHLMHFRGEANQKNKESILFKSQKCSPKGGLEEKETNVETTSCKNLEDNPFLRAKRNILNKQKNTPSFSKSGKSLEEDEGDFTHDKAVTTFRVLKRGSLNTPLSSEETRQI